MCRQLSRDNNDELSLRVLVPYMSEAATNTTHRIHALAKPDRVSGLWPDHHVSE